MQVLISIGNFGLPNEILHLAIGLIVTHEKEGYFFRKKTSL